MAARQRERAAGSPERQMAAPLRALVRQVSAWASGRGQLMFRPVTQRQAQDRGRCSQQQLPKAWPQPVIRPVEPTRRVELACGWPIRRSGRRHFHQRNYFFAALAIGYSAKGSEETPAFLGGHNTLFALPWCSSEPFSQVYDIAPGHRLIPTALPVTSLIITKLHGNARFSCLI